VASGSQLASRVAGGLGVCRWPLEIADSLEGLLWPWRVAGDLGVLLVVLVGHGLVWGVRGSGVAMWGSWWPTNK
jgi:hypothetical protein